MSFKSVYIMAYVIAANSIAVLGAFRLFSSGADLGWAGVLLAWLPGALFFNYITLTKSLPRTTANLPLITYPILTGALLTVVNSAMVVQGGLVTLALGICGLITWLAYVFWYSRYGARDGAELRVGNPLPEFTLEDENGRQVGSGEFLGKPALFLFYRGNWCPLCMAQVREIAGQYQDLAAHGVQVVLISPQPHGHTKKLARRFDVPFTYLVDAGNKVANQLKLVAKNGLPFGMQLLGYDSDTVMPTVVITDKDGTIVFADLTDNYRVRPEPGTFMRILENQAGGT